MTEHIQHIAPSDPASLAWHLMRRSSIHHLVVMDAGKVVGLISDQDLRAARTAGRGSHTVAELMSSPVVTANPTTTLRRAASLMRGRSIGCLPIMDGGRLVGIVTISDLLNQLGAARERSITTGRWKAVRQSTRWPRAAPRPTRH